MQKAIKAKLEGEEEEEKENVSLPPSLSSFFQNSFAVSNGRIVPSAGSGAAIVAGCDGGGNASSEKVYQKKVMTVNAISDVITKDEQTALL